MAPAICDNSEKETKRVSSARLRFFEETDLG